MSPADRAKQTARRKAIYEELHPETKQGAVGRGGYEKARQLGDSSEGDNVVRFTADTAERTGKAERVVQRDAERGEKIDAETLDLIRGNAEKSGLVVIQPHFAGGFLRFGGDVGNAFGVTNIFPINAKLFGDFGHATIMWLMSARVGNFPTLLALTLPKSLPLLDLLGPLQLRQLGPVQILSDFPQDRITLDAAGHWLPLSALVPPCPDMSRHEPRFGVLWQRPCRTWPTKNFHRILCGSPGSAPPNELRDGGAIPRRDEKSARPPAAGNWPFGDRSRKPLKNRPS